ncbi:carbonate dehydratase [Sphingorhabdus lutea]|uniref:carbonic anhydrase n=1 Tax=Sphingorhabdus lutea TaxID=1913578 RepID=A0A1L3JC40_9SPHN|nr:carbonic anhydrase [Sphingorhabdus lutea]APG62717.1 carbonate dehydratase [Sphingorhabdus lutea]
MPEFAHLVSGYKRFRQGAYLEQKSKYDLLSSDGQMPPVMIISCCDSRVDPATIFDTVPGQVFALRNVANLVPPYQPDSHLHGASAAIEFGVTGLNVQHIVILGHGQCGGIKAALQNHGAKEKSESFVHNWMSIIDDAVEHVCNSTSDDKQLALELEAIKISLHNLRTFPYIKEREDSGQLKLHGTFFAISDGILHVLDEETGLFSPA